MPGQTDHRQRRPQQHTPILAPITGIIVGSVWLLVGYIILSLAPPTSTTLAQQPTNVLSPTPTQAAAPNLIDTLPTLPIAPSPTPKRTPTVSLPLATPPPTATPPPFPSPHPPLSATHQLDIDTDTPQATPAITQTSSALSADPLPGSNSPVLHHAPIPTPNLLPSSYGRLLPSHGGWAERQNLPKFMTLPFSPDPYMVLLQGWFYDSGGLQSGIDYFRQDANGTFTGFPVLAAADGYACGEWDPTEAFVATGGGCVAGYGHRVLIRHELDGETYYTYYGHLETIAQEIPLGSRNDTAFVKRGQFLGYAGNTGTAGSAIHLHFGIFNINLGWLDPYDLRTTHEYYPDPNIRYNLRSGYNDFWTTNPPSYSDEYHFDSTSLLRPGLESFWTPDFPTARQQEVTIWQPSDGAIIAPNHNTIVTDTIRIQGWATAIDSPIETIELRIDDEQYAILDYASSSGAEESGKGAFSWEWDTTTIPNGVHTIQAWVHTADEGQAVLAPATAPDKKQLVVNVQNIQGTIEQPNHGALLQGKVPIQGWAKAGGSSIAQVEIWVDGTKWGEATYGETHYASGGDYGFSWEWDTGYMENGTYTLQVWAVAANGATGMLERKNSPLHELTVQVENVHKLPLDKWSVR